MRVALALPSASLLQGCAASARDDAPPRKEATRLSISLAVDSDANCDIKGRGAPLLLRFYELKSASAFQEADFFTLQDHDRAALGADLLAVDPFILRPGETRTIRRQAHAETTALGVFAAFRDLPNAVWRITHTMPTAPDAHWYRTVMSAVRAQLALRVQARSVAMTDTALPS